jgi:hypothetical protein
VDAALFARVQQFRAQRTTKDGPNPAAAGGLLTGVVWCAVCGKRMWYHRSGRGAQQYYLCSGRDHRTCRAPSVPAPAMDDAAVDVLRHLSIPMEWHAEIIAAAEAILAHEYERPAVERAALMAQLQRLGVVYADGAMSDIDYARRRDVLRAQLAAAEQAATVPDLAQAAGLLHDMDALIDAASDGERRALVRQIFSVFWLEKTVGIKAITPTELYLPLVRVMVLGAGGVADGRLLARPHTRTSFIILRAPRPLHRAGRAFAA